MVSARSWCASLPVCLLLVLAGCGTSDGTGAVEPSRLPASADAPALPPDGSSAVTVSYRCVSGREGTLTLDLSDGRDLAETLDRVQPCEYDDGIRSYSTPSP